MYLPQTSALKKEEAWYLQEVEVVNTKNKKSWHFFCNQWFSLFHGDCQTLRELFPQKASKTGGIIRFFIYEPVNLNLRLNCS